MSDCTGYEGRIGRYGPSLARALIAAVGVRPGDRVLDVGCGSGALTAPLAAVTGAERVCGVDPAAEDVETCRARVPGADVRVGEASELPSDDGTFDAVLSQLVLGHLRDAVRAVREMARVTRPGGTVAACVWDFAEGMTVLRAFWDAAARADAAGAARFDQARTHPHSTPPEMAALWEAGGLADVRTGELVAESEYRDFDDLWRPMLTPDGAPGRFLATVSPQVRDAVRERLFEALGRPAGAFTLRARAWYVAGRSAG